VNKKQEREKCKILPYLGANIVKYEAVKFETTFCIAPESLKPGYHISDILYILLQFWMPVSNRFLTKFITLEKFTPAPKRLYIFCLPYTGHHGFQIRSQLHKILSA
jgi:hypothetical protein